MNRLIAIIIIAMVFVLSAASPSYPSTILEITFRNLTSKDKIYQDLGREQLKKCAKLSPEEFCTAFFDSDFSMYKKTILKTVKEATKKTRNKQEKAKRNKVFSSFNDLFSHFFITYKMKQSLTSTNLPVEKLSAKVIAELKRAEKANQRNCYIEASKKLWFPREEMFIMCSEPDFSKKLQKSFISFMELIAQ